MRTAKGLVCAVAVRMRADRSRLQSEYIVQGRGPLLKTRFLVAAGIWIVSSIPCFAQCVDHATLGDSDRRGFLAAAYGQDAQVAVEFLSADGCDEKMLAALVGLGAKVRYSDARVGYALVTLPRERVLDALDISGIAYATVARVYKDEGLIPVTDRRGRTPSVDRNPVPSRRDHAACQRPLLCRRRGRID